MGVCGWRVSTVLFCVRFVSAQKAYFWKLCCCEFPLWARCSGVWDSCIELSRLELLHLFCLSLVPTARGI